MLGRETRRLALAALAGAAAAMLLDPHSGRRRRALVGDKLRHYRHTTPRGVRGAVRGVTGPMRGAIHAARRRSSCWEPELPDDNLFIKQRVESELGHETDLPMENVTLEAFDGVVRLRGTVPDSDSGERLVERTAGVDGVKAVESLLRLPDGTQVTALAGDADLVTGPPRAVVLGEQVVEWILARWPGLADTEILASEGHVDRLVALIQNYSDEPAEQIRAKLDEILLAAV